MCFSAEASFIAGSVLTVAGIASIKKAGTRRQMMFASVPLLFAAQQFTEGVLWIVLPKPEYLGLQKLTTYTFLFFAQVVWPSWVPISVLLLEKDERRKKILRLFSGIGLLVSCYLCFRLFTNHVYAEISDYHIHYDLGPVSVAARYFGVFYFIATAASPFISGIKKLWIMGAAILSSYIISFVFFHNNVISVWCFFAAIISVVIYFIIADLQKTIVPGDTLKN